MDRKKIILIAGGGHCKVVISVLGMSKEYEIAGIVDRSLKKGDKVSGVKVIGSDDDLADIRKTGIEYALITMGSVYDNSHRRRLFDLVVSA